MFKLTTLSLVLASIAACAHAAPANLCDHATRTAKRADIYDPDGGLVFPSDGADYSTNPAMVWDISNGKDAQFTAVCYPNELGQDNSWPSNIPKGSSGCTFLNGNLTCE